MRILILSFYYQPDLSAGSFRTTALVDALLDHLPPTGSVEVITTLPNRYSSFAGDAPKTEESPRLTVHRIALPAHKSGMIDQSKAFFSYARGVSRLAKTKDYDLIYATSSRLMTAALGAWIARSRGIPLYLDIRDIFVDTIKDVLPKRVTWLIKPVFSLLEGWTIRAARKVNLVSEGFLPYLRERYPNQRYSFFTNGVDESFIDAQPTASKASSDGILEVVYAGNFGEGQGLHNIIPQLARMFEGKLRFRLIGDGGRRRQLVDAIESAGCNNVEVLAPMKRELLIEAYRSADVLFLHLNDYEAFRKVLPSKLFEYAALGKPVWAGVSGYAADFVSEHIDNAAVFPPCDALAAVKSFERLRLETKPRVEFVERFARTRIMKEMSADIYATQGKA